MKKWHYYNDNDRHACAWARELIRAGLVPDGEVDQRPIQEVQPDDLKEFTQCHFFSGILGWPLALRLAGWPDDRAVWTGSCPCQPFSDAGEQRGESDARHLWPEMRRLLSVCRPATVFGEQVASKLGREWLAGVRADLEDLGYAVGAADLCAAGVGAPHIRQRLFWVADAERAARGQVSERGDAVANGHDAGRAQTAGEFGVHREAGGLAVAQHERIPCRDGKARRIEPGTCPLAHGVSGRVGLLRGYGNAIVPPLAARFIQAALGLASDTSSIIKTAGDRTLTAPLADRGTA